MAVKLGNWNFSSQWGRMTKDDWHFTLFHVWYEEWTPNHWGELQWEFNITFCGFSFHYENDAMKWQQLLDEAEWKRKPRKYYTLVECSEEDSNFLK